MSVLRKPFRHTDKIGFLDPSKPEAQARNARERRPIMFLAGVSGSHVAESLALVIRSRCEQSIVSRRKTDRHARQSRL